MHIPDGFLSLPVSAISGAFSVGGIALAVKRLARAVGDRLIPLMGVMAAFIFAAQMFNFPVAGGTSGHLLGGALAAIVLGPMAGTVVLTVVLIVLAVAACVGVGLFPQILAPTAVRLAGLYTFLAP